MNKTKVLIVDDSKFSRAVLAESLTQGGCEVVGEADSIKTLIEVYQSSKPDIVTMDIAMPGADGFECSKEILKHDRNAKIILVSSMMDDESVADAKRIGIKGYIQKPVEDEHLLEIINKILAPDTMYENLCSLGMEVFKEVLVNNITRMTKINASINDVKLKNKSFAQDVVIIIGITGKYTGTIILNLSEETANKMAEKVLKEIPEDYSETLSMIAEFANIISGIGCSMLNKKEKALSLRVTPPSILYGKKTEVVTPSVVMHDICAETEMGDFYLSFGIMKEAILWT